MKQEVDGGRVDPLQVVQNEEERMGGCELGEKPAVLLEEVLAIHGSLGQPGLGRLAPGEIRQAGFEAGMFGDDLAQLEEVREQRNPGDESADQVGRSVDERQERGGEDLLQTARALRSDRAFGELGIQVAREERQHFPEGQESFPCACLRVAVPNGHEEVAMSGLAAAGELAHQRCLARARLSRDEAHLPLPGQRGVQVRIEAPQLFFPSYERLVAHPLLHHLTIREDSITCRCGGKAVAFWGTTAGADSVPAPTCWGWTFRPS